MVINYDFSKGNVRLSPHFLVSEFRCSATNTIKYSTDLIAMLEKIFENCKNVGQCVITSGYRTPAYSVKVGGSRSDAHTYGLAADCVFYDKKGNRIEPKYIACYASDLGFGGIGVMKTSIHLDVRHLGGYPANKKWHGDETKNYSLSAHGKTFYQYYNLTKDTVYNILGIAVPKPVPKINYLPKYTGKSTSISDALKSLKIDNSFAYRKKIAAKNCIKLYAGTAKQNSQMLTLLKAGKLIKP